jgi:CHAT domain-containing protein
MKGQLYFIATVFFYFLSCISYSQNWKLHIQKADSFSREKLTDSAIVYYLNARKFIHKDSLITGTYLDLNKKLVRAYFNINEVKKTDPLLFEIKNLIEKNYGLVSVENANWNEEGGSLFFNLDYYLQAKDFFLLSKDIRKQLKKEKEYTRSCNLLGNAYINLGEYSNAEEIFLEAMPIRERLFTKESNEYAQMCNNLGDLYRRMGDYDKAEQLAVEAKEIRGRILGPTSLVYAISCVNLANVYRDIGQYKKAEPLYLLAKKIRGDSIDQNPALYASSCNILADLYYFIKEYNKAEALYLEAMQIRKKLFSKFSYSYAQSCNNISALYRDMYRLKEAEALALEAKEIYAQVLPQGHPTFPINYNNLGDLYMEIGDFPKAEGYYLEARKFWDKSVGKTHPYYTNTTLRLANVYWNKKELSRAKDFFKQGVNEKFNEINKIFEFTNEAQKQSYLNSINSYVDDFLSFQYAINDAESGSNAYQISLQNRNLILSSGKNLKTFLAKNSDSVTGNMYYDWRNVKERLAFLYTQPSGEEKQKKELEEKAENLEKQLTRHSSFFKKNTKIISWKEIQKKLKPTEAAIEFAEFNLYNGKTFTDSVLYIALLLRKDRDAPQIVPLFEKKELDSLFQNTRNNGSNSLYNSGNSISSNSSRELYRILWKPLENDLKDIKKIFFSPAGLLHRIAFAALSTGDSNRVLSDQYELQHLASTADVPIVNTEYVDSSNNIYAYGGILYDADSTDLMKASYAFRNSGRSLLFESNGGIKWEYLEGSEKEINLIEKFGRQKKYSVTTNKGILANEESLKALNGEASPSLLHIATHGFFFPDPVTIGKKLTKKTATGGNAFKFSENPLFRSGLLFAGANNAWLGKPLLNIDDGILTAYEVSNLYLPNTRLVVLSACETGLGDIQGSEGVYGLQRAFKMAGVQNLIMSLWKVPDVETAEFMEIFYSNLFDGKSVNNAFYLAQTQMKNKYRAEPYKWAAWILVQ